MRTALATSPPLTIVVPTFNGASRLRRLLFSILNDDYSLIKEVCIGDDGSTESLHEAISPFREHFPIHVRRQDRAGERASAARNLALGAATGDVALFLDDDVTVEAGVLHAHAAWHRSHPASLLAGMRHRFRASASSSSNVTSREPDYRLQAWSEDSQLPSWYFVHSCHMSVPIEFARLGFDADFSGWGLEDLEFAYRLSTLGVEASMLAAPAVEHVDAGELRDPFRSSDLGLSASFNAYIANCARFIHKHNVPEVRQLLFRSLDGLSLKNGNWIREPGASQADAALRWGTNAIASSMAGTNTQLDPRS